MGEENICSLLPPEIWEHIFTFLRHSEKDLLICRKVCASWAEILDNLPPAQIWTPWFYKQHNAGVMLTFRHTPGTVFQSKEDLLHFLLEVEQRPPAEQQGNPFINSTLIINWRSKPDYDDLQLELPAFLNMYGSHVRKLLYFIQDFVPETMDVIPPILESMRNLRSLLIYCDASDEKLMKEEFWFPELPRLKHFCELELLGICNYFLLKLFVTQYGPQLRSLSWWDLHSDRVSDEWKFDRGLCPNLVNLKIQQWRMQIEDKSLLSFVSPLALKRFACKLVNIRYFKEEVSTAMNVAAHFAATLEMICLDLKLEDENLLFDEELLKLPKFLSLNEFVIPYAFVACPLLPQLLLEKMKNLRKLVFLDTQENFQNRFVGTEELNRIFQPLWTQLSLLSSVQEISIRSRQFNSELQRHFPVYHKSSRPTHLLSLATEIK